MGVKFSRGARDPTAYPAPPIELGQEFHDNRRAILMPPSQLDPCMCESYNGVAGTTPF